MCFRIDNSEARYYGDDKMCYAPIGVYGLYQVNEFVIDLNECDRDGVYKRFLAQRIAGKIFGTLGYAAISVAVVVESVVMIALAVVALLPSLLFKNGFEHVFVMAFLAAVTILDIPVRAVSGFVQNVLFSQQKSFEDLDVLACLSKSCTYSNAEAASSASTSGRHEKSYDA